MSALGKGVAGGDEVGLIDHASDGGWSGAKDFTDSPRVHGAFEVDAGLPAQQGSERLAPRGFRVSVYERRDVGGSCEVSARADLMHETGAQLIRVLRPARQAGTRSLKAGGELVRVGFGRKYPFPVVMRIPPHDRIRLGCEHFGVG